MRPFGEETENEDLSAIIQNVERAMPGTDEKIRDVVNEMVQTRGNVAVSGNTAETEYLVNIQSQSSMPEMRQQYLIVKKN